MMIQPTTSCLREKISHLSEANLYLVAGATFPGFASVRGVTDARMDAYNNPEPLLPDLLPQTGDHESPDYQPFLLTMFAEILEKRRDSHQARRET